MPDIFIIARSWTAIFIQAGSLLLASVAHWNFKVLVWADSKYLRHWWKQLHWKFLDFWIRELMIQHMKRQIFRQILHIYGLFFNLDSVISECEPTVYKSDLSLRWFQNGVNNNDYRIQLWFQWKNFFDLADFFLKFSRRMKLSHTCLHFYNCF